METARAIRAAATTTRVPVSAGSPPPHTGILLREQPQSRRLYRLHSCSPRASFRLMTCIYISRTQGVTRKHIKMHVTFASCVEIDLPRKF